MQLSVVVVACDELDFLKRCLPAASAACAGIEHEIIVVDNASHDGVADWVDREFPSARLAKLGERAGLSSARNCGIRESSGEYCLFLDADATLSGGAARSLVEFMETHARVGIAGPRVVYPDGRFQESCRTFQTWGSFVRRALRLGLSGRDRGIVERARRATEPLRVDWILGACQIVRRSAVDEVGPMDERFRLYYGDVEWCRRMKAAGWEVVYVPSAECAHQYQRKSAGFPPGRWAFVHLSDFTKFRQKPMARARRPGPLPGRARILYLFDLLGLSGPPIQYATLVRELDRSRFEPVACATLVRAEGDGALAHEIGLPLFCFGKRGFLDKYVRVPLALRRMIRAMRVDIIHSELLKMNLLAAFVGPVSGAAVVMSQSVTYGRNPNVSRWDGLLYTVALRLAHRTIVNAEVLRREALALYGAPLERVRTIRYAPDPRRLKPTGGMSRADLGIERDAKVLVMVARLVPEKGHSILLRSLGRLRSGGMKPVALFAGDGPERTRLESEAGELGLGNAVRFLGPLRHVADVLAISDIFVLSSFYEGMPAALMEAMAAGVPVVATAVDGTVELVEDGVTGRLVPPGDEEALAGAIRDALRDVTGSRRMADRAREMVLATYTIERMVAATEEVYDEALGAAGRQDTPRSVPRASGPRNRGY